MKIFNEEQFMKTILEELNNSFSKDVWLDILDGGLINIIETTEENLTSYPSIYIYLDDNFATANTKDSDFGEKYTSVSLKVEIYANNNSLINATDLSRRIAYEVKETLYKLNFICNQDIYLPYLENNITRKQLKFSNIIIN